MIIVLSYKSFEGEVKYPPIVQPMCGEVCGVPQLHFLGNTIAECRADFQRCVDSYLEEQAAGN